MSRQAGAHVMRLWPSLRSIAANYQPQRWTDNVSTFGASIPTGMPLFRSLWLDLRGPPGAGTGLLRAFSSSSTPAVDRKAAAPAKGGLGLSSKLSTALSLQIGALWQRHRGKVYASAAVATSLLLWRLSFLAASSFVSLSETMANWGLLGISIGLVAVGAQGMRWYYGINPAAVYRHAMLRLNTSPAVLEVMGAPLVGSDLRATITTGGHLYLSKKSMLKPKISARRLQMMFPLRGSERDGLVSLEVKRKQGQYVFKLLAVDIRPGAAASLLTAGDLVAPRIYIKGDNVAYGKASSLGELRDPFLKAVHLNKHLDAEAESEQEEAEDARAAVLGEGAPNLKRSLLSRLQLGWMFKGGESRESVDSRRAVAGEADRVAEGTASDSAAALPKEAAGQQGREDPGAQGQITVGRR